MRTSVDGINTNEFYITKTASTTHQVDKSKEGNMNFVS